MEGRHYIYNTTGLDLIYVTRPLEVEPRPGMDLGTETDRVHGLGTDSHRDARMSWAPCCFGLYSLVLYRLSCWCLIFFSRVA